LHPDDLVSFCSARHSGGFFSLLSRSHSSSAAFLASIPRSLHRRRPGMSGASLTYQQSASFTQNGGAFAIFLLSYDALGIGLDNALFTISLNSVLFNSWSFTDLASAETFCSNNLIDVPLLAGFNTVELAFSETMSRVGGFSVDYAVASSGILGVPGPIVRASHSEIEGRLTLDSFGVSARNKIAPGIRNQNRRTGHYRGDMDTTRRRIIPWL
jgi:hypothetical protein